MSIQNTELQLAHDFVVQTNSNIFLTGKAGTGKTTFLHTLKRQTAKRIIVTAPTGVAAINAGGVTLHSFFQMPFGPFVPGSESYDSGKKRRFNKEKIKIIKSLDLLVIDEISMVRADVLDGVDAVLRQYRRSNEPFGGVQLLMIGDLNQLPPVVKESEWNILRQFYESFYFFSSNALAQTELISIELKHIYRQSDSHFIDLLNRVRDNRLDPLTLSELNKRFIPDFVPADNQGYIILSTHNSKVGTINDSKLKVLPGKAYHFAAAVEGEFPEYSYPTSATLELKVGAQVMFVRNDSSYEKLYFNGKIGEVTRIFQKSIWVKCPGDAKEIVVEPLTWENIKYKVDIKTKEITENVIGKFVQYPLKLAWAITIHKSQGLTFEKAVIDAQSAFAHGQVYVALSRCKTFEGLVLSSPITPQAVKTDVVVVRFNKGASHKNATPQKLEDAKLQYEQNLLLECFGFETFGFRLKAFISLLYKHRNVLYLSGIEDFEKGQREALTEIVGVGEKFKRQLRNLFADKNLPEKDAAIMDRVIKASTYFQGKINDICTTFVRQVKLETDNKEIRKKANTALNLLAEEIAVKRAAVKSCEAGFSPDKYLRALSVAEIDFKPKKEKKTKSTEYLASDVGHPELFQALRDWRSEKAAESEVPHFRIMHQKTLLQIAVTLPGTLASLQEVPGVGSQTVQKYGDELVALISAYRKKHNIVKVVLPELKVKLEERESLGKRPLHTRQMSIDMFRNGLSIAAIAEKRGLVVSTIEGHMAFGVEQGEVEIDKLLSQEKLHAIMKKNSEMHESSLSEIKNALGEDYTYGEIKFVRAHLKYLGLKGV